MPSPLEPLSKLAGRVSPHYTVTYLLTVAFAFAAACIVCGVLAGGWAEAALVAGGIVLGIAAFGLMGYLMLCKSELLRSEPHLRFLAIMSWSQDPALDEEALRRRERMLPKLLGDRVSKGRASLPVGNQEGRDE